VGREQIEVFRPPGLGRWVELRRGADVYAPYPRHWHDEYQLCLISAGGGELIYRGSAHLTPATSLFIVHPREVHANETFAEGCSFRSIYIAPELMARAASEIRPCARALPLFPVPTIYDHHLIRHFDRLHLTLGEPASELERESQLLDLLAVLIVSYSEERPITPGFKSEKTIVCRVRNYLEAHYAENVQLKDLAAIAGFSPYHLNRVFRAEVGLPPHAYQTQLRIAAARRLLRQGWPIAHVAAETGFADQSHLTRQFQRLQLISPGQYQSANKSRAALTSASG
jgi:AraC-like DNA-binding protein